MKASLSVLGRPLESCSEEPMTGWYRDGCCNTDARDRGSHTVCAVVTEEFLLQLKRDGNDLTTPNPDHGFPGLKDGDGWCVCAASWYRAYKAGIACPVKLESTHAAALQIVPLKALAEHALSAPEGP